MTLKDLPVFFLDLQTTGARPGQAHILEMAWSLSTQSEVQSHLIRQPEESPVPRRILSLTGIKSEELENSLELSLAFQKLLQDCAEQPAVIHFAQFERPFLKDASEKLGHAEFSIICTHAIAKRLFPNLPARGIKGLAGYFGHFAGELKRASSHVEATRVIWNKLVPLLAEQGIHTLTDLQEWISKEAPKKRSKYEYPLPKEKRLTLPNQPGVYRYLSQWGEILYVGKATSLKDRVNSYFRGQKNRDHRKLEMLTQAWDLRVTVCRTPLESALLETDEIKQHNPRYNISLKAGARSLVFFNRDFTSSSSVQDENHSVGPFSSLLVFDSVMKLAAGLREPQITFAPDMFFELFEPTFIQAGFELFCERFQQVPSTFANVRSILAMGLSLVRRDHDDEVLEILAEETEEVLLEEIENEAEEVELTVEDMADKFERHFKRAARAYLRARTLTQLLNSDIEYNMDTESEKYTLYFREGRLEASHGPIRTNKNPWVGLSIETYDRMSVLLSELTRIQSRTGSFNWETPR